MKLHRHTIPSVQGARDIKVWGPRAIATVLWEIGSQFELLSGHQLDIDSALADSYVDRVNSGEHFDVFIGMSALVETLIKSGKLLADSRTPLVRCGMGVEVRAGAPLPDISSVKAFTRTLLEAKSIGFLNIAGGVHIEEVIMRLGIAEALHSKTVRPRTDIVSEVVAKGDLELGMVITGQILTTHGVQLAGPLPPELQSYVVFVGGVCSDTKTHCAARDLLGFLTGKTAQSVIRSQGMDPISAD